MVKQPIKGKGKLKKKRKTVVKRKHSEFGTSQLEKDFARDFLDKLGLKYVYQYKADDIGRYFDFAIAADNDYPYEMVLTEGVNSIKQGGLFNPSFIIEVDGDYHHANPDEYKDEDLNPMQKHNKRVDSQKDYWCGMHCIPLLRIWEHDIRKNQKKVFEEIGKYSAEARKKLERKKIFAKPH